MRQINIEQLKIHLNKELNDLPFEITKRSKVIAIVKSIDDVQTSAVQPIKEERTSAVQDDNQSTSAVRTSAVQNPKKSIKKQAIKSKPIDIKKIPRICPNCCGGVIGGICSNCGKRFI